MYVRYIWWCPKSLGAKVNEIPLANDQTTGALIRITAYLREERTKTYLQQLFSNFPFSRALPQPSTPLFKETKPSADLQHVKYIKMEVGRREGWAPSTQVPSPPACRLENIVLGHYYKSGTIVSELLSIMFSFLFLTICISACPLPGSLFVVSASQD